MKFRNSIFKNFLQKKCKEKSETPLKFRIFIHTNLMYQYCIQYFQLHIRHYNGLI